MRGVAPNGVFFFSCGGALGKGVRTRSAFPSDSFFFFFFFRRPPAGHQNCSWNSMEFHGNPWNSMETHGIPWNSMEFYGNLWTATKWPPKQRIWTRTGAKCTARCGDSEYEGPGVDFGKLIFGISGNFELSLGNIFISFGMVLK